SASKRWSRFQQGVDDRPTRWPISATESEASSCTTARIFRSMASILSSAPDWTDILRAVVSLGRIPYFRPASVSIEKNILFQEESTAAASGISGKECTS